MIGPANEWSYATILGPPAATREAGGSSNAPTVDARRSRGARFPARAANARTMGSAPPPDLQQGVPRVVTP